MGPGFLLPNTGNSPTLPCRRSGPNTLPDLAGAESKQGRADDSSPSPPLAKRKKIPLAEYKRRAALLKRHGVPVDFNTGASKRKRAKSLSPARKAQVSKKWEQVKFYLEGEKQKFVFKKASPKMRKKMAKGLASKQVTETGFFVRVPKGVKRAPTYKEIKGGVEYKATGPKGGKRREIIKEIDAEQLADDPKAAIESLKPRGRVNQIFLTVNGFDSEKTIYRDLEQLAFYFTDDLLPRLMDPAAFPEHAARHGKRALTEEEISDIFHVKFVTFGETPPHAKKTKAKSVGRNRKR